jgi:hypothetical protein
MVQHNTLTGADLHECKGADAAAVNTVRVADGAGSGTWKKLTVDSIDVSSIKNANKQTMLVTVDPAVLTTVYIPIEQTKTLTGLIVIANTTTTGSITTTANKNGAAIGSTVVVSNSAGTKTSGSFSTSFDTTDAFTLVFSGTTTSPVSILMAFSL